jgi:hypothetical protein
MALGRSRNGSRDLEMLLAASSGVSPQDLAVQNNLSLQRVQAILTAERHKMANSPSLPYRALRQKLNSHCLKGRILAI